MENKLINIISEFNQASVLKKNCSIFIAITSVLLIGNAASAAHIVASRRDVSWELYNSIQFENLLIWGPLFETLIIVTILTLQKIINNHIGKPFVIAILCIAMTYFHMQQADDIFGKTVYFATTNISFAGFCAIYLITKHSHGALASTSISILIHSACNAIVIIFWLFLEKIVTRQWHGILP